MKPASIMEILSKAGISLEATSKGHLQWSSDHEPSMKLLELIRTHKQALIEFIWSDPDIQSSSQGLPPPSTVRSRGSHQYLPVLQNVWSQETGWLKWNSATGQHDIPLGK